MDDRFPLSTYPNSDVTQDIVESAVRVHRTLGPGLLESAYRVCLAHELTSRGRSMRAEVPIPIDYNGKFVECGYRADLIIDDCVLIELKAVDRLLTIHEAQVLTYLKLAKIRVGMLINFNTTNLRQGIKRLVR